MLTQFFSGFLIAALSIPAGNPPTDANPLREAGTILHATANAVAVLPAPIPDVVVPGTRGIKVEMTLDASVLADHCCVQHVVKKGETLSQIAANHRKHLLTGSDGSADRIQKTTVEDIVALNPGLQPDKLAIGQRIWMPPRIPAAKKTENTFVFIDQSHPFGGLGTPFSPSDAVRAPYRGQTAFRFVPASQLADFQKTAKSRDWKRIDAYKKAKDIPVLSVATSGHRVWDESPVHSCKDKVTIARDKAGKFTAKLDSVAYDKEGKVVPPKVRNKNYGKNKRWMWLLILPSIAGGWLLVRNRRQREPAQLAVA